MSDEQKQTAFFVIARESYKGRDDNGDAATLERDVDVAAFPDREHADKYAALIEGARVEEREHEHDKRWHEKPSEPAPAA